MPLSYMLHIYKHWSVLLWRLNSCVLTSTRNRRRRNADSAKRPQFAAILRKIIHTHYESYHHITWRRPLFLHISVVTHHSLFFVTWFCMIHAAWTPGRIEAAYNACLPSCPHSAASTQRGNEDRWFPHKFTLKKKFEKLADLSHAKLLTTSSSITNLAKGCKAVISRE